VRQNSAEEIASGTVFESLLFLLIAVFSLDAGLLARSQYSEGPATGHLETGFFWFPFVLSCHIMTGLGPSVPNQSLFDHV